MEKLVKYGKFILLFMWVHGVFAQQVSVESPVRFLALGDSYTIGQSVPAEDRWPEQLAERLKTRALKLQN